MMRAFSERHPEITLTLAVGNRAEVLARVLDHTADVAISGTPPGDERLAAVPVRENRIVCITAPDDPAAGQTLDAGELAGRTWLLREPGSGTRALNEQFLAERGLEPQTLTLGSNGAIKQAARAGLSISLLSSAAVEAELDAGRLGQIRLRDEPARRAWFVLRLGSGRRCRRSSCSSSSR